MFMLIQLHIYIFEFFSGEMVCAVLGRWTA